jgi:ribosomal protein S18 acetylase RimI-like enzyme
VTIRQATDSDLDAMRDLWEAFEAELDGPGFRHETWEEGRAALEEDLHNGVVLIAEEGGEAVGFADVSFERPRIAWLESIYVSPDHRRRGLARTLLAEVAERCREHGSGHLGLDVLAENRYARSFYERLGFFEYGVKMAAPLAELQARLGGEELEPEPSFGLVYAQTDDAGAIERAAAQFIPRLGRSERTAVHPPRNGWTSVEDELCSRDPKLLRRLAQELSYRTGGVVLSLGIEEGAVVRYILFERGSVADEYASVPEYFGPLPPGDVVALSANPTVVSRLTGADPARVRAVARTASTPAELPPAQQLVAELTELLGIGSVS